MPTQPTISHEDFVLAALRIRARTRDNPEAGALALGRLLGRYKLQSGEATTRSEATSQEKAWKNGRVAKQGPVAAGVAVRAADTGRILMLQRRLEDGDPNGGKWEFPGGKIDEYELPHEAAVREWCEETGLALPEHHYLDDGKGEWVSPNGKYHGFVLEVPHEGVFDLSNRDHRLDPDGDGSGAGMEVIAWVHPNDFHTHNLRPALLDDLGVVTAAMAKHLRRACRKAVPPAAITKSLQSPTNKSIQLLGPGPKTKGEASLIDLPDIRQQDDYSCGAACAMAVGRHFRVGPDDLDEWKTALGTTKQQSTQPQTIADYLKSLGLSVDVHHDMTLDDLRHSWRNGRPVICPIQEYGIPSKQASYKYGHYVAVIGLGLGYVFVFDPSIDNVMGRPGGDVKPNHEDPDSLQPPGRTMIDEDTWMRVWHDEDVLSNKYECYGISVGPPARRVSGGKPVHEKALNGRPGEPTATVAVDLDGTICEYDGWKGEDHFGELREGAAEALDQLKSSGCRIIIFTTRGNTARVGAWLESRGVPFDYINENPDQPEGSNPGKVIADIYIDDRAVDARRSWEEILSEVMERVGKSEDEARKSTHRVVYKAKGGPCGPGERADLTGCVPLGGKPEVDKPTKPRGRSGKTAKPGKASSPRKPRGKAPIQQVEDPAANRPSKPEERDPEAAPKPKPFKEPPPKKGVKGGGSNKSRPTGDQSQTVLGDQAETLATKLGFRDILPKGQRCHKPGEVKKKGSTIDLEYDHCLTPEHEALTRDGWKKPEYLNVGDEILGYDHESGTCSWQKIQFLHEQIYNGEILEITCRGHTVLRCTPNHRLPVVELYGTDWKKKRNTFITAKELSAKHTIPISAPLETSIDGPLSVRHAKLLGWVVTDGCGMFKAEEDFDGLCVDQSWTHNPTYCREIAELVGRSTGPYKSGNMNFRLFPHDTRILRANVTSREGLVSAVCQMGREQADAIVDAMIKAEASTNANGAKVFCQHDRNMTTAEAFQVACVLSGRATNLRRRIVKDQRTGDVVRYACAVRTNTHIKPIRNSRWVKYRGYVWCPQVRTGAWVVRCNGAVMMTGNSGRFYELKMCQTSSTEYRLKAKKKEKLNKEKFARLAKGKAYTMVGVRDVDTGEVHFYGSKTPGLIGAEVSEKNFDYLGTEKL